jgi:hypothetical protein
MQRSCTPELLEHVQRSPIFKAMDHGIDAGEILPTLRKDEVHFYEAGARLFQFTQKSIYTHRQYVDCKGDRERRLCDRELTSETVELIRKRCREYCRKGSELRAVHSLFREFAITHSAHLTGEVGLIDVEARFASNGDLKGRMIDLVFLLPDRRLLFIEAKCIGNPEARSTKTASVETQVEDCERHIARDGVLDALTRSLQVQSKLVGRELGEPIDYVPLVPVVILDPTCQQPSNHSRDAWLRRKLEDAKSQNWSFKRGTVDVIDGTRDPAKAIREYVDAFLRHGG